MHRATTWGRPYRLVHPVYPTEKNADLLSLILKTSSNEGSLVLDCFAGSGTTLKAAEQARRQWIGIDQSGEAVKAIEKKLGSLEGDLFQGLPDYTKLTAQKNAVETTHS